MQKHTGRGLLAAALAGAVILFLWGGISHLVLLAGVGFQPLPQEQKILPTLRASIPDDGLYFFPGIDLRGSPTPAERQAFEAKYRAGPTGLLLYHPTGDSPVSPQKLLKQFLSQLLAAALAAYVASLLLATYARRVLAITALGVSAWLTISTIYWNWYGFPHAFFLAQGLDQIVGWLLAGLAIAKIVPPVQAMARQ